MPIEKGLSKSSVLWVSKLIVSLCSLPQFGYESGWMAYNVVVLLAYCTVSPNCLPSTESVQLAACFSSIPKHLLKGCHTEWVSHAGVHHGSRLCPEDQELPEKMSSRRLQMIVFLLCECVHLQILLSLEKVRHIPSVLSR